MKPDDLFTRSVVDSVALADRCVQCGACVPHCPTYRKTLSEADSPRGRIALMRGVLEQRIPANARYTEHIDLCTACGACDAVCPNAVDFHGLLISARFEIWRGRSRSMRIRLAHAIASWSVAYPRRLVWLTRLLGIYQSSGLQALARRSGLLRALRIDELDRQLPRLQRDSEWDETYPPAGRCRGEVGLFLGCVARVVDAETLAATIFVLNKLGYRVRVPRDQSCCGALHRHAGDAKVAERLAETNRDAFAGYAPLAVVGTASGCTAELASNGGIQITDISAFLAQCEGWEEVRLSALPAAVAVHDPCTLRNRLGANRFPYALLARIPDLKIEPLAGNAFCCGAAGSYFLTQPAMANSLLADKISSLKAGAATILCTSNVGCALYLAAGIREADLQIDIVHPVTLIARQMGFER